VGARGQVYRCIEDMWCDAMLVRDMTGPGPVLGMAPRKLRAKALRRMREPRRQRKGGQKR